ncbi:MAG: hypothetical protein EWM72_03349 [Nitrospira sp.]|nr:MAG: hypothetical protein EWM72_03349 [Nitrospira sp.]
MGYRARARQGNGGSEAAPEGNQSSRDSGDAGFSLSVRCPGEELQRRVIGPSVEAPPEGAGRDRGGLRAQDRNDGAGRQDLRA